MMNEQMIRTYRDTLLRPLEIVQGITERRISGRALTAIINTVMMSHAGGPESKGKTAAVSADVAIASTGTNGATVTTGDDDDDGDGDPDSDRAPHNHQNFRYTKTFPTALDRKRVTGPNRILRMAELKIRIGLSRSTIYDFIKVGNFPRQVSLGTRAVGWLESDVDSWLESRVNASQLA